MVLKVDEATDAGRIELTSAVLAASCELFKLIGAVAPPLAGELTLGA